MKKLILSCLAFVSFAFAQQEMIPDIYLYRPAPEGVVCVLNSSFFNPQAYNADAYPDYVKLKPDYGMSFLDLSKLAKLEAIMSQSMDLIKQDKNCDFVLFTGHISDLQPGYKGVTLKEITAYRDMLYNLAQERGLKVYDKSLRGTPPGETVDRGAEVV